MFNSHMKNLSSNERWYYQVLDALIYRMTSALATKISGDECQLKICRFLKEACAELLDASAI